MRLPSVVAPRPRLKCLSSLQERIPRRRPAFSYRDLPRSAGTIPLKRQRHLHRTSRIFTMSDPKTPQPAGSNDADQFAQAAKPAQAGFVADFLDFLLHNKK